jgi:hypothetical protein
MSTHSSLDRHSFENYLASVLAVQKSGLGAQSVSALVELQREIMGGGADLDRVMPLVAEGARNVANATGIAIALLKADQLVYRAASGSAAGYVGRRVVAVLTGCARGDTENEILRVENAEIDSRIESAICSQFGAKSLLILPIFQEHTLVGVIEIFFSEPHTFDNREVVSYRLMLRFIEDAMLSETKSDLKNLEETQAATVAHGPEQVAHQAETEPHNRTSRAGLPPQACVDQTSIGDTLEKDLPALCSLLIMRAAIINALKPLAKKNPWRSIAALGMIAAIAISGWFAYNSRPASPAARFAQRGSNTAQQAPVRAVSDPLAVNGSPLPTMVSRPTPNGAPIPAFKRIKRTQNEIDYIAEDVTIRHFLPKPSTQLLADRQLTIGQDVTVRYFAYDSEIGSKSKRPARQSADSSVPATK